MRVLGLAGAIALATGCGAAAAPEAQPARAQLSATVRGDVTLVGMRAHLLALQRIADRSGGTRGSGTPGYEASAQYVRDQLARAGYRARLAPFPFTAYRELVERARQLTPVQRDLRPEALQYSPSTPPGGLTAPVVSAGDGCEARDFRDVARKIALVRRGLCFFSIKAQNAGRAGAAAVIVYNNQPGTVDATLGSPNASTIPAVAISAALGEALAGANAATVRLEVRTSTWRTTSRNVIAERPGTGRVLMVGAHLDSVESGPGINDNGTGVAALIEIAAALRRHAPGLRVRFAFWGAEEFGLFGSRAYVGGADRSRVAGYLNFDMLGSRRFIRGVYRGPFSETFLAYFRARNKPTRTIDIEGRSDHAPFAEHGIPTGGLFAGDDACYHRACDRLDAVNLRGLDELADTAAHAIAMLAPR